MQEQTMTDVGHDARRGLAGRDLLVMMRPSRPLTGWYRLSTGIAYLFTGRADRLARCRTCALSSCAARAHEDPTDRCGR